MDPPSRSPSRGLERPHWAGLGGSASRKSERDFRGPPKGRVASAPRPCSVPGATPGVGDCRGGVSALLTALPRHSDAAAVGAGPGRPRLGAQGSVKGRGRVTAFEGPSREGVRGAPCRGCAAEPSNPCPGAGLRDRVARLLQCDGQVCANSVLTRGVGAEEGPQELVRTSELYGAG